MAYLKSKDVKVFPSAYRSTVGNSNILFDPESRIPSEFNLSNIVNRIVSKGVIDRGQTDDYGQGSFVVSYSDNKLICAIHGYFFELTIPQTTKFNNLTKIYAYIKLKQRNTTYTEGSNTDYPDYALATYNENIDNLDTGVSADASEFTAISLEGTDRNVNPKEYKLFILEWVNNKYQIPSKSKFKISASEIATSKDSTTDITKLFKLGDVGKIMLPADDAIVDGNDDSYVLPHSFDLSGEEKGVYLLPCDRGSFHDFIDRYSIEISDKGFKVSNYFPEDKDKYSSIFLVDKNKAELAESASFVINNTTSCNVESEDPFENQVAAFKVAGGAYIGENLKIEGHSAISGDTLLLGNAVFRTPGSIIFNGPSDTVGSQKFNSKDLVTWYQESTNNYKVKLDTHYLNVDNTITTNKIEAKDSIDVKKSITVANGTIPSSREPNIKGLASNAVNDAIGNSITGYVRSVSQTAGNKNSFTTYDGNGGDLDTITIDYVETADKARSIADPNGNGINCGNSGKSIYLENGVFKECQIKPYLQVPGTNFTNSVAIAGVPSSEEDKPASYIGFNYEVTNDLCLKNVLITGTIQRTKVGNTYIVSGPLNINFSIQSTSGGIDGNLFTLPDNQCWLRVDILALLRSIGISSSATFNAANCFVQRSDANMQYRSGGDKFETWGVNYYGSAGSPNHYIYIGVIGGLRPIKQIDVQVTGVLGLDKSAF